LFFPLPIIKKRASSRLLFFPRGFPSGPVLSILQSAGATRSFWFLAQLLGFSPEPSQGRLRALSKLDRALFRDHGVFAEALPFLPLSVFDREVSWFDFQGFAFPCPRVPSGCSGWPVEDCFAFLFLMDLSNRGLFSSFFLSAPD